ncbi:MAG: hypothetical protein K2J95_08780 [Lachnospiraceae bacterium]|nr:hypothetical protein [Lachnospiraceae bacterium]MDE6743955.1 hypothetical protein [Lachnospiraceae bacterium]
MVKKKKDDNGLANKIIAIVFLLFLIAGGYYLFSMFRPVEINQTNIVGEWKLPGSPVTYYSFRADGTASSYEKFTGSGEVRNQINYTYYLRTEVSEQTGKDIYTIVLDEVRGDERHWEIEINALSHVQMNILWKGSEFSSMTRVDVF